MDSMTDQAGVNEPLCSSTVSALRGRDNFESVGSCRGGQATIVSHQLAEVASQQRCSGQVDGVERSDIWGENGRGREEDAIIYANEFDAIEYVLSPSRCRRAKREDGARDFGPRERARDERSPSAQIRAQRGRLGLSYHELHDR